MEKLVILAVITFIVSAFSLILLTKNGFRKMLGDNNKSWKLLGNRTGFLRLVILISFLITTLVVYLVKVLL